MLRWALYLAADVARQCDPALAALYRRLMVERGRYHTQAVCAVASLVERIYAVARAGGDYVWRDLEGNEITKEEARVIAQSRRVDPETRARLRARAEGGPRRRTYARQPEVPQDVTQPSEDKLIDAALELASQR